MDTTQQRLERLAGDPRYQRLVRRRAAFGWALTALMLLAYFGFIFLVAFAKPFMGSSLAGGATSVGIPLGIGVILFAITLTGLYVHRANHEFDGELAQIRADYAERGQ